MSKGRKADPGRARRGTGNRPQAGKSVTKIAPQTCDPVLAQSIAAELPDGLPRAMFQRAVSELAGRLNDTDLEALRMMAWACHRHQQAQEHVEEHGIFVDTAFGPQVNPMLKVARDEGTFYLKIADQYALTFVARLRAGLLQLAGQSLLTDLHSGIADAIVARIASQK